MGTDAAAGTRNPEPGTRNPERRIHLPANPRESARMDIPVDLSATICVIRGKNFSVSSAASC
jgi:hypothetical protein